MAARSRFMGLAARAGSIDVGALAADPEVAWAAMYRADLDSGPLQGHGFRQSPVAEVVEVVARFPPAGASWIYRVEQRQLLSRTEEHASAVWLVAPMHRKPGTTPEHFETHWTEEHGALALAHHPGLIEYRQNVVIDRRGEAPSYDGIAVLGFPSADAFVNELFDDDAGRAAIAADTARFVDPARLEVALMTEYLIKG